MEDYRPVIYEVANPRSGPGRHDVPVQVVLAKDADGPPFGAPYIFSLGDKCSSDCDWFSFQYAPGKCVFRFSFDVDGSAAVYDMCTAITTYNTYTVELHMVSYFYV